MVLVSCFGLRFVIDCYDFLVLCLVLGWGLFPSRRDCPTLTDWNCCLSLLQIFGFSVAQALQLRHVRQQAAPNTAI